MKVALFFEVQIKEGLVDTYLGLAAGLRPSLDAMGGCLFIDRFRSLTRKNLVLSYQIWRDEASMTAWRADAAHHSVQETGREKVFSDYRIRVAQVVHEERRSEPAWTPERLTPYNDPARRPPTYAVIAESNKRDLPAHVEWRGEVFESVYRPGVFAHLADAPSPSAGVAYGKELLKEEATEYFRVVEVLRDYGMFDRRESPQYYPPVNRAAP